MKQIFKKTIALICCAALFIAQFGFSSYAVNVVYPVKAVVNNSKGAKIYSKPGTPGHEAEGEEKNPSKYIETLKNGTEVICIGQGIDGDGDVWYQIKYGEKFSKEGYAYSPRIKLTPEYTKDAEFEKHLTEQNFPESYKTHLRLLHVLYPNWVFIADEVKADFDTVVDNFTYSATNTEHYKLVHTSRDDSWKSMEKGAYDWERKEWYGRDGDSWVTASERVVAYHVDPRNFLNTNNVFMFFNQSYNSKLDTVEGLANFLKGTFMEGKLEDNEEKTYAEVIFEAAKKSNVSPYVLASIIRQEQGTDGTGQSISGTYEGYEGYYNYFNIGAYASGKLNAIQRGLWWAKGASDNKTSYNRPWNTREKSIIGGAEYYGEAYISKGQDTLYYKNFNVYNTDKPYTHQYATNIEDTKSTSITFGKAYEEFYGEKLEFHIPVYRNMPAETTLPESDTSNDRYLQTIKVDDLEVEGFDRYKYDYEMIVPYSSESIDIKPVLSDSKATVKGGGKHTLKVGDNEIKLTVTSTSGLVSTYILNISREKSAGVTVTKPEITGKYKIDIYITNIQPNTKLADFITNFGVKNGSVKILNASGAEKKDGNIATGDRVYIYKTDGTLFSSYAVVIYGDANGDGKVNSTDRLRIRRYILREVTLEGEYLEAADANDDGKVNSTDRLRIRKYILREATINQMRQKEEN